MRGRACGGTDPGRAATAGRAGCEGGRGNARAGKREGGRNRERRAAQGRRAGLPAVHEDVDGLYTNGVPVEAGVQPTMTAPATTVVQSPCLSPTAVWVTAWVRTILFDSR